MNMQTWLRDQMTARKRQALPLLSAPAVQLMGIRVGGLLSDSNMQAQGMYQIARRCPAAAAVAPMVPVAKGLASRSSTRPSQKPASTGGAVEEERRKAPSRFPVA